MVEGQRRRWAAARKTDRAALFGASDSLLIPKEEERPLYVFQTPYRSMIHVIVANRCCTCSDFQNLLEGLGHVGQLGLQRDDDG